MHPLMLYIDLQVPEPGEAELSSSAWYIKCMVTGCTDYWDPGKLQDQKEASGERYELYLYTSLRRRDTVLRMDQ